VIEADFSKMLETSTAFKKDKNIKKNSFVWIPTHATKGCGSHPDIEDP
jgi:hypothetical protein